MVKVSFGERGGTYSLQSFPKKSTRKRLLEGVSPVSIELQRVVDHNHIFQSSKNGFCRQSVTVTVKCKVAISIFENLLVLVCAESEEQLYDRVEQFLDRYYYYYYYY